MDNVSLTSQDLAERTRAEGNGVSSRHRPTWWRGVALIAGLAALASVGGGQVWRADYRPAAVPPPPPQVTVSVPLQQTVHAAGRFLGQFSAVDSVELRAQVGGTLTKISFKDGDIVREGDVLFEIDPTPYQIKLDEAKARVETAHAQLELAIQQLGRADTLKQTGFGTVENADQRLAQKRAAQASLDDAQAAVRDAQFDLDHTRVTAPFTGRIGTHLLVVRQSRHAGPVRPVPRRRP